ncbi:MAG: DUF1573 domain-containing protein [Deltaproteobacteria bacterium]|nr:DUF1573 domain-containing protein [Deltaproteobacteria bacterium]
MEEQTANNAKAAGSAQTREARPPLMRFVARLRSYLLGPLLVAVMVLLGFCGWSIWQYGDLATGVAYLNGSVLVPEASVLDLGEVCVGGEAEGVFRLRNLTDQPITIIGGRTECSCVLGDEFPVQVDAMSFGEVSLRFTPGPRDAKRHVVHRTLLYLDVDAPEIVLTFSADVVPSDGNDDVTSVDAEDFSQIRLSSLSLNGG